MPGGDIFLMQSCIPNDTHACMCMTMTVAGGREESRAQEAGGSIQNAAAYEATHGVETIAAQDAANESLPACVRNLSECPSMYVWDMFRG